MICENCRTTIPDEAKFCPECGAKIEIQLCPMCGASNPATAKFCRTDGTPLAGFETPATDLSARPDPVESPDDRANDAADADAMTDVIERLALPADEPTITTKTGRSIKWRWIILAVLLVVFAGAGGYVYISGGLTMKPADFQKIVNEELRAKDLNVTVDIDEGWVATVTGFVKQKSEKDRALGTIRAHKEIKDLLDNIALPRAPADVQADVNAQLSAMAYNTLQARVDENYAVYLTGYVKTMDDKVKVVDVIKNIADVKEVRDEINIVAGQVPQTTQQQSVSAHSSHIAKSGAPRGGHTDLARLEGEINRSLRGSGIHSVTAEVKSMSAITLKGTVRNAEEKKRVFDVVSKYTQIRNIRDIIFIVGS